MEKAVNDLQQEMMDKLHEHAEKFREFENKLSIVDEDVQNLLQDQIRTENTGS